MLINTALFFSHILMAVVFGSTAFAPVEIMKSRLCAFAEYQSFSFVNDGLRDLFTGNQIGINVWLGLIFSLSDWLIFRIASVFVYKKHLK
ncbi:MULTISPECIES: hypothetical protein [Carnobacterium]|uniref:hypothetical protein n=1 Tax=Carnobacterium TaxID=2747 RepID=UPI002FCB10D7